MNKFIFLIAMFISLVGFGLPINGTIENPHSTDVEQKDAILEASQTIIKPDALAPKFKINNPNSENIFNTDYFASYYFKNLKGRFGNNIFGSCSYIATEMVLSYYDSFWCDDFLAEKYDGENVLVDETILNASTSPGSKNESNLNINPDVSGEEYYHLVNEYKDDILHFDLVSRGIEKYNLYDEEKKIMRLNTSLKEMQNIIYEYLDESTVLGKDAINIVFQNSEPIKMREIVVERLKQGIPVIIDATMPLNGSHSFVAYDYDEANDEIYCNAGWYDDSTYHISMTDLGYTVIQEIMYFEPKIDHSESFNYSRYNSDGNITAICACSSMIPTEIEIINNFLDVSPTFRRNSLIKDKWSEKHNLRHTLSFLKANKVEIFQIEGILENQLTINRLNRAVVINNVAEPNYYVYITVTSDSYPYLDDYYCSQLFTEPNRYYSRSSFLPEDWGFEGRYYFSNELTSSIVASDPERMYTTITQNGLTIETERLRCGYIEESYIVLSPRREGAGKSYFEMNFDKPVYSFAYRACMWSASENLDGEATIWIKNSQGNRNTLGDIPISSLKTKDKGLTLFSEMTLSGVYGLRFETNSTATGDRNKGRFCLGDIIFTTSLTTALSPYFDYDYAI